MSMWSAHSGGDDTLNLVGSYRDSSSDGGRDPTVSVDVANNVDEFDETGGLDLLGFDADTLNDQDAEDLFLRDSDGSTCEKNENEMMDARFLFAKTPHPSRQRMPLSLELHLATSPSSSTFPSRSNAVLKGMNDAREAASPVSVQLPLSHSQLNTHVSPIQPPPLINSAACAAEKDSLLFLSPTRGVVYNPTQTRSPPPQSPSPSTLPSPSQLRARALSPSMLPVRSSITTSSVAKLRNAPAASAKSISTPSGIPSPSSPSFSFSSKIRALSSPGYTAEAKRTLLPIRAESSAASELSVRLDLSSPSTGSPSSSAGVGVLEVLDHVKSVGRFSKKQQGAISEFINLERETMLASLEDTMTANATLRAEVNTLSMVLAALREDLASLVKKNAELGRAHHEIWNTLAGDLVRVTGERDALAVRVAEADALLKEAGEVEVEEVDVLMGRIVELERVTRWNEVLQSRVRELESEEQQEEAERMVALQGRIRELEVELSQMGSVKEVESDTVLVASKAENEALKTEVTKTRHADTLSTAANQSDDEVSQDLIATLSAQNETLSAALEALRSPIASDRIDALEQENARLRAELQSHPSCGEQDAFTLDARIAVLQADVSRLAEEKADLFALHEDLVQCNAVMHAESTRLQEDRVLRGAQVEEWEREVVELRVQLSQALNSVECLRAVCKKMEDAFEGAKARVVELEGTICVWEEAGRDKTRHARRVEEYEREINGLCESIDVLKMRVEVLGQENAGLRSQLEELNATKWV